MSAATHEPQFVHSFFSFLGKEMHRETEFRYRSTIGNVYGVFAFSRRRPMLPRLQGKGKGEASLPILVHSRLM